MLGPWIDSSLAWRSLSAARRAAEVGEVSPSMLRDAVAERLEQ